MNDDANTAGELETVERLHGPAADWSVIWLHGLGADGHDFEPIVDALAVDAGIRYLFPHAPVRTVTVNGGMRMRGWYDIASVDLDACIDHHGIAASVQQVHRLLEREEQRGIPARRIVLAGFSQGGVIALHAGLGYPRPLAGVVALSTYLPGGALPEGAGKVPVFVGHGDQDPVVAHRLGLRAGERLRQAGLDVTWNSYPMPHAVCEQEIADISRWMRALMA